MNHKSQKEPMDDLKYFKLEIVCHNSAFINPIFIKSTKKMTIEKHSEYRDEYLKEKIKSIETYHDYFLMKHYLLIKLELK